mgnify:CR=1 FL=1
MEAGAAMDLVAGEEETAPERVLGGFGESGREWGVVEWLPVGEAEEGRALALTERFVQVSPSHVLLCPGCFRWILGCKILDSDS